MLFCVICGVTSWLDALPATGLRVREVLLIHKFCADRRSRGILCFDVHTKALRPPLEATTGQTMHPSVQEWHTRAKGKGHRRARLGRCFEPAAVPRPSGAAGPSSTCAPCAPCATCGTPRTMMATDDFEVIYSHGRARASERGSALSKARRTVDCLLRILAPRATSESRFLQARALEPIETNFARPSYRAVLLPGTCPERPQDAPGGRKKEFSSIQF